MKALAARGAGSKKRVCRELILHCLSIQPTDRSTLDETVQELYGNLAEEYDQPDLGDGVTQRTVRKARKALKEEGRITMKEDENGTIVYPARVCACGAPVPKEEDACPICEWPQEFQCPTCHGTIQLLDLEDDPRHCPNCREEIDIPTPWVSGTELTSPPQISPVQEELAALVGRADPEDVDMATEELTQILRGRQLIGHARRMRQLVDDASTMTDGDLVEGVAELLEDAGFRD